MSSSIAVASSLFNSWSFVALDDAICKMAAGDRDKFECEKTGLSGLLLGVIKQWRV